VASEAGTATVLGIVSLTVGGVPGGPAANVFQGLFLFSLGFGIPSAIAVAVFKHRLYELDFVVKKTIVLGMLAAFISLVYVGLVVWLGSSIPRKSNDSVLVYSAAAVVAVGFQPLRTRAD